MRYKVAPGPPDRERLHAVSEAVPLVPASVEDCCTRIRDRTAVPSREVAREWLTFCQGLGLVDETDRGYYRLRDPPDDDALAAAFNQGVFGAREVLAALDSADRALGAEAVFEAVREVVPKWERDRSPDWEAKWRERVRRLLGWGVVFGHLERAEDGYRVAD